MSEIEREDILAQRQEEMQRIKMRSQLDQMVKDQSGRKDDSVSKSAKRMYSALSPLPSKHEYLDTHQVNIPNAAPRKKRHAN